MQPYERLLAWQRCHELVLEIYRATKSWPDSERFGLTAQLRRAAVSAASNIVEENARRGPAELARFLQYAVGSLAEATIYSGLLKTSATRGATMWPRSAGVVTMRPD